MEKLLKKELKAEVLSFVLQNSSRNPVTYLKTRDIMSKFILSYQLAYEILNSLSSKNLIIKFKDGEGDNFDHCLWIKNRNLIKKI